MTDIRWVRIVDVEYTTESDGYKQTTPIIHLFGRDTDWERHHIKVDRFLPYFAVRQSEWAEEGHRLQDDGRVLSVETTDHRGRTETAIDGEQLIRIVCREPSDVADLQEMFADPFEADVQFPTRFLVDLCHSQWIGVDENALKYEDKLALDHIVLPSFDGNDDGHTPPTKVPPTRICLYDIEVEQGGDGPPVVSEKGTERAANDITAITAYDSYTMEYRLWALIHDSWDASDCKELRSLEDEMGVPLKINLYDNPADVVSQFVSFVVDRDFDSLCGWNADSFDHPYLINYGLNNGVYAVNDLSPFGYVQQMNGDGNWINSSLKGRQLLDLMSLYDKTTVSELDSYRLADVADSEDISVGKLDLSDEIDVPDGVPSIDYAWQEYPKTYGRYSIRDVQACVGINTESKENVSII